MADPVFFIKLLSCFKHGENISQIKPTTSNYIWLFYYKCYLLFKTKRHKLSHALLLTYYLFSFPVKFLTFLKSVFTSSSSISIFWIDAAVSQKNVHEIITTNIFRSAMQLRNMRTLRVYFEVTPKTEATFPKLAFEILCKCLL